MSRRPMLPAVELRRFTGSPRALLALFAVVLVPLILNPPTLFCEAFAKCVRGGGLG